MKYVRFLSLGSLFILLTTGASAQDAASKRGEELVRSEARLFVSDIMKTHDVRPLLRKWFFPKFEYIARPEDEYVDDEPMWRPLTPKERRQVLIASWNVQYAGLLINHSTPKELECYDESKACDEMQGKVLRLLFPTAIASAVEHVGRRDPNNVAELVAAAREWKEVVQKVLPVFKRRHLEKTERFKYWFKLFEEDRLLNYYIKSGQIENDIRDA